MAKKQIRNDVEYWQIKEDLEQLAAGIEQMKKQNESDKKVLKRLHKEASSLEKTMSSYEKKKKSDHKKQDVKERIVRTTQKKSSRAKEENVVFSISAVEMKYFDYRTLDETQKKHLMFKKSEVLNAVEEGTYIQLYDDETLYCVRKDEEGQLSIVSVVFGEALLSDIALIVRKVIKAKEIAAAGQILR